MSRLDRYVWHVIPVAISLGVDLTTGTSISSITIPLLCAVVTKSVMFNQRGKGKKDLGEEPSCLSRKIPKPEKSSKTKKVKKEKKVKTKVKEQDDDDDDDNGKIDLKRAPGLLTQTLLASGMLAVAITVNNIPTDKENTSAMITQTQIAVTTATTSVVCGYINYLKQYYKITSSTPQIATAAVIVGGAVACNLLTPVNLVSVVAAPILKHTVSVVANWFKQKNQSQD